MCHLFDEGVRLEKEYIHRLYLNYKVRTLIYTLDYFDCQYSLIYWLSCCNYDLRIDRLLDSEDYTQADAVGRRLPNKMAAVGANDFVLNMKWWILALACMNR